MADTDYDLDPGEQRKREAGERLVELRTDLTDMMCMWLEERRDRSEWQGSYDDSKDMAQRMGDAAMRVWLPEAEFPLYTVPHYFDLPKEQA